MVQPTLQLGSTGSYVAQAQDLLNRGGALLDEDGQFGHGTEEAVREAQARARIPATGIIDDFTWTTLLGLAEPNPNIATRAVSFIGCQEVGSRPNYDQVVCHPCYPGGDSGITIGVGYDLRTEEDFVTDWSPYLSPAVLTTMKNWVGLQGSPDAAQSLRLVSIPWSAAWAVYTERSLPKYVAQTSTTFRGFSALPPLCRGMLVSLVYNRGSSTTSDPSDPFDRRREMREIQSAIEAGNFAAVPDLLRSMKRLWPAGSGLRTRRDQEADLFEIGLQAG